MSEQPRINFSFTVHWCERHLRPFHARWPQGAAVAMVELLKEALALDAIAAECPTTDDGKADAAHLDEIDGPTWVYNAICEHGLSLYVGMSRDVPKRISQHRNDKPWWNSDVWAVTADLYSTRARAAEAEMAMITLLHPHRNIVGREPWWMEPSQVLGLTPVDQACFTPLGKDPLARQRGA